MVAAAGTTLTVRAGVVAVGTEGEREAAAGGAAVVGRTLESEDGGAEILASEGERASGSRVGEVESLAAGAARTFPGRNMELTVAEEAGGDALVDEVGPVPHHTLRW